MAKNSSLTRTIATIVTTSALTLSVAVGAVVNQLFKKPKIDDGSGNTEIINNGEGNVAKSIDRVEKTNSYGLIDEYTIFYTDATTSVFIVTNGSNGEPGIQGFPGIDGHTPEITIGSNGNWLVDGVDTGTFATGPKGDQGEPGLTPHIGSEGHWWIGDIDTGIIAEGHNGKTPLVGANGNWWIGGTDTGVCAYGLPGPEGPEGRGIASIAKTDSQGLVDIYTITYTDGTTSEFLVTNGANGETAAQGLPGQDGHTPEITIGTNGNWIIDGVDTEVHAQGPQGEQGIAGTSLKTGEGEPLSELGMDGDSYIDTNSWNYYVKANGAWELKGNIKGESNAGNNGLNGKSAYEIAVDNGYTGTEAEWLASLIGEAGANGDIGNNGKSAYELAVENGFNGTEEEWLITLIGPEGAAGAAGQDGKSVYELAIENGFTGSLTEWLTTLVGDKGEQGQQGEQGKSAYDLAVENGYSGTLEQWLSSLAGEDGVDGVDGVNGKSAYELAVENGFTGTFAEWIVSLHGQDGATGQDGKSAYELAVENGFSGTFAEWMLSLQGQAGADGSALRTGNGEPTADLGIDGDSFIDLSSFNYYVKEAGSWVLKGNIKGQNGDNGISIVSVEKTNTNGLIDTYTITYSDGNESTFTVTNGVQGADGNTLIIGTGAPTDETTANIGDSYIDVSEWKLYVKGDDSWTDKGSFKGDKGEQGQQGEQGEQGEQGVSITDIAYDSSSGLVDTYIISYSDGTNDTFAVTNGQDGTSLKTGYGNPNTASVDDPSTTVDETRADPITGIEGDSFLDLHSWDYYVLEQGSEGLEWVFKGNIHNVLGKYEVSFDIDGGDGTAPDTQIVDAGSIVSEPAAPTKNGYIFQGWYTEDGTKWEFDTYVASRDITLVAHWAKFKVVNGILVECTATGAVNIPAFFNEQLVTGIAPEVFKGNENLTSVEIPYTITTIGESAFEGCTGLTSLVIPHNVKTIGDNAFKDCTNVVYLFLREGPSTSTSGFLSTNTLSILNGQLLSIGEGAFENLSSLKALTLPESVGHIGFGAFRGCDAIKTLNTSIFGDGGSNQFLGYIFGGTTYDENETAVPTSLTTVVITGNRAIPDYAMANCINVKTIVIADQPTSIGLGAFQNTASLEAITIPYIGDAAFKTDGGNGDSDELPFMIGGHGEPTGQENAYNYTDLDTYDVYKIDGEQVVPLFNWNNLLGSMDMVTFTDTAPDENTPIVNSVYVNYTTGDTYIATSIDGPYAFYMNVYDVIVQQFGIEFGGKITSSVVAGGHIFGTDVREAAGQYVSPTLKTITLTGGNTVDRNVLPVASFYGFENVENIILPDNLVLIDMHAFYGCRSLQSIVIPSHVREISNYAFYKCEKLAYVSLPNNLEKIGNYAFSSTPYLKRIIIPESVQSIGHGALFNSGIEQLIVPFTGLARVSTVDEDYELRNIYNVSSGGDALEGYTNDDFNNIKHIIVTGGSGENADRLMPYAFFGLPGQLTVITIPNTIRRIEERAFCSCHFLESVNLPEGLEYIGNRAFSECGYWNPSNPVPYVGLNVVTIPSSVSYIGDEVFASCVNLEEIYFLDGAPRTYGDSLFTSVRRLKKVHFGGIIKSFGDNTSMFGRGGANTNDVLEYVYFGEGLVDLPNSMFRQCTKLNTVILPNSLKTIGDQCFFNCRELVSVSLSGVETIGESAFSTCVKLEHVYFGNSLISIGNTAFYDTKIKEVETPGTLTTVGDEAFYKCPELVYAHFNAGAAKTFGSNVFYDDNALVYLNIEDSIVSIGDHALEHCDKLKYVYIGEGIEYLPVGAFRRSAALTSIVLPESLKAISENAFDSCSQLETIVIPNHVETIGRQAFVHCGSLNNVIFNDGLKAIQPYAFEDCLTLTHIEIPDSVTDIGYGAFFGSSKMESMKLPASYNILNGDGYLDWTTWPMYLSQLEDDFGEDGDIVLGQLGQVFRKMNGKWVQEYALKNRNGNVFSNADQVYNYIGFFGAADPNAYDLAGLLNRDDLIYYYHIYSGSLYYRQDVSGSFAFHCTFEQLYRQPGFLFGSSFDSMFQIDTNSLLPSTLKSITISGGVSNNHELRNNQFKNATDLEEIILDSRITTIGNETFIGCSSLKEIVINGSVTSIGDKAFENCRSLWNVTFLKGNQPLAIGNYAFIGCTSLGSIDLPDRLTSIGYYAFSGCSNLLSIVIPEKVTKIEKYTFSGCSSLAYAILPEDITVIREYAFEDCTSLTAFVVPDSVQAIGIGVFYGCNNLETLVIPFAGYSANATFTVYSDSNPDHAKPEPPADVCNDGDIIAHILHIYNEGEGRGDDTFWVKIDGQWSCQFKILNLKTNSIGAISVGSLESISDDNYFLDVIEQYNSLTYIENATGDIYENRQDGTGVLWRYKIGSLSETFNNVDYYFIGHDFVLQRDSIQNPLKNVTITKGNTVNNENNIVANHAFYNNENLITVTLGEEVKGIGEFAFDGCNNLKTVNISKSLIKVGQYAFANTAIESLNLPKTVTSIGKGALKPNQTLTSYKSIQEMVSSDATAGVFAFKNSLWSHHQELTNIEGNIYVVTETNKVFRYDGTSWVDCGLDITVGFGTRIKFNLETTYYLNLLDNTVYTHNESASTFKSLTLPFIGGSANGSDDQYMEYLSGWSESSTVDSLKQSIESIALLGGNGASKDAILANSFKEFAKLKEFTIADGITNIGGSAFMGCSSLKSIIIPDSVSSIGAAAFGYCTSLTSVKLPNNENYTTIDYGTFDSCKSLRSINIPNSVTTILGGAFNECTALESLVIPNSVTSIDAASFIYCSALRFVTLPNNPGFTSIQLSTFYGCTSLQSIIIPNSVTSIGDTAFAQCNSLQSIVIPNSVTTVGSGAFMDCTSLQSVVLPNNSSYTAIAENTFNGCSSLLSIYIPNNVTSIKENSFNNCFNLMTVRIHSNITTYGDNAFKNCVMISTVIYARVSDGALDWSHYVDARDTNNGNRDLLKKSGATFVYRDEF